MKDFLLVGLGGFAGSALRYGTGLLIAGAGWSARWPLATLAVNAVGSLLIGVLAGSLDRFGTGREWALLGMTGFCGGFTTFSAFSLETVKLLRDGNGGAAALYVLASVAVCLTAAWGGWALAGRAG